MGIFVSYPMKRYSYIVVSGLFLLFNSFRLSDGNPAFFSLLNSMGMKFTKPANTIEVKCIQNDELNYQYAIKDTVTNIEIRYSVFPLQKLVEEYNGPHPDTGLSRIDPNFLHTNYLFAIANKIQGKEMNMDALPEVKELSHATVDLEFNADWGAETTVQPCDEFAQKYKYCTIFEMHKDNIADVFIMYLYDDKDTFDESIKPDFHSLAFKK